MQSFSVMGIDDNKHTKEPNGHKAKVMREIDQLIRFEKAKREIDILKYNENMKKLDKLLKL